MDDTSRKKTEKHICTGILAHVDAGKTTLAEGLLYLTGRIRKLGRVDHRDAFLDTFEMERARGITIFSKQAGISWKEMECTLLDTPGHVDFSAEMERTLQILDYGILIISGPDGVQGHDLTLWKLLQQYRIPVFVFVNKMDMPGMDRREILERLQKSLDGNCVDFGLEQTDKGEFLECLAMCGEELMQEYLDTGTICSGRIQEEIHSRRIFPCYFGAALKLEGVEALLEGFRRYAVEPPRPQEFGARVYKISRDSQGSRLTHLKVTGGNLRVKMALGGEEKEKIDQIRIYSGSSYQTAEEAASGQVCAVTGLESSFAGKGYGFETGRKAPVLEPVLSYRISLPEGSNVHECYLKLCQLEEEEPQLHIVWDEQAREIQARVMGEVQMEVLKNLIRERYGFEVQFDAGSITYKETILEQVEGVGHFEPLRHYAEVHLLMEPMPAGSGLTFEIDCSEDLLDRNWQRLILTHLEEKVHRGVLTGSEITDMRITLVSGKAHLKHTEGGDFRQATYRAVRQGLKSAQSVLLEPVYSFRLEVPLDCIGRAMSDVTRMSGHFQEPETEQEMAVLTGDAPVSEMREYYRELISYTRGRGRIQCSLKGYEPCHNQEEVVEQMGYDSESDLENPTGSVFCAHGAGFVVPWNQVKDYMHLESAVPKTGGSGGGALEGTKETGDECGGAPRQRTSAVYAASRGWGDEKELEEIFSRTYGSKKEGRTGWTRSSAEPQGARTVSAGTPGGGRRQQEKKEYLLVDGYNIIFAIPQLKDLAELNIDSARTKLMDLLCNYQGYRQMTLILVYDAYKVEGGIGSVQKYHNIFVVYTKEAETADQYIEKTVHDIGRKYHVTVATSDALEQRIIWGGGASRMSAAGLWEELEQVHQEIAQQYLQKEYTRQFGQKLFQNLDQELADLMEDVRLGKKELQRGQKQENTGGMK